MGQSNQETNPESTQELLTQIASLQEEIAALKESNKSLLVNKQQLDAFFDNAPVKLYLKDRDGRYLRINEQFETVFNVKNKDVVGLFPWDLHDDERANIARELDVYVLNTGKTVSCEGQFTHGVDHQIHTFLTVKFPVYNDKNEINGVGAIVTDITESKSMEDTLRRIQKMDAVGQLTGGIAHDFNNILGVVMGNLELIDYLPDLDEKTRSFVKSAYSSANRGAELTRKLLSFSRTTASLTNPVNLNTALRNMEALITKYLSLTITTRLQLEDNLWTVNIDPGDLEDAILNLSINARDAMPEGGEIVISTSNKVVKKIPGADNSAEPAGDYVEVSVRDTGQGMSGDLIKKSIEPFFTTKAPDEGTGLGLSMVYGFAKRSGGSMRIVSEINEGTEVIIRLPRFFSEDDKGAARDERLTLKTGSETILVVDDDISLAEIASAHLSSMGYRTLVAHSGAEALGILNTCSKVDLLFADVIMPGEMDGHLLATKTKSAFPGLKVLLTSGFSTKGGSHFIDESELQTTAAPSLLHKPYSKLGLSNAIRNALDHVRTDL